MATVNFDLNNKTCNEFIDNLKPLFKAITPEGIPEDEKNVFVNMREAVLGSYFLVETISNLLLLQYLLNSSKGNLDKEENYEKLLGCFTRISFKQKIQLMEVLFTTTHIDFSVFSKLDDLRDVFAHNLPYKDERYGKVKSIKKRHELFVKITSETAKLIRLKFSLVKTIK